MDDAVKTRIINLFDRLAHPSTDDQDALQTVYGLRRVVKGTMPSTLLASHEPPQKKQISGLKKTLEKLRADLIELQNINAKLEADHARLQTQLLTSTDKQPHQPGNDYCYDEVMQIIRNKFGKQNGALTLWAEYSMNHADPSNLVTTSKLQTWRNIGVYPAWAVEQLLAMPVITRVTYKWSPDDIEYLCLLHQADPLKTDDCLADECSIRFGCKINANSIKSKFNILRKEGRIPMVRPPRPARSG